MSLDHILLGLLGEPAAGYDLKAEFEGSAAHFWSAHLSQIYPTLKRMEAKGWLTSSTEPSDRGPERRVYERTAKGRSELEAWLRGAPEVPDRRLPQIGQLFFLGQLDDPEASVRFVQALRRRYEARRRALERVEREWEASDPDVPGDLGMEDFHAHLTLRAGLRVARARVRWCDEALERMEARFGLDGVADGASAAGDSADEDGADPPARRHARATEGGGS